MRIDEMSSRNTKSSFMIDDVPTLLSEQTPLEDFADEVVEEEEEKGFYMIILNDKVNYVTPEYKLLSSEWFDAGSSFHNGWASVIYFACNRSYQKYNFINTEGKLFSTKWATNDQDRYEMRKKVWGTYDEYDLPMNKSRIIFTKFKRS